MWLVMYRNEEKEDNIVGVFTNRDLVMENYFPFGLDDKGRHIESSAHINDYEYVGHYLIEIDKNRSSLIASLLNETITNFKFENRW